MKKNNNNSGWCIIIYGFSGSGKTQISKKIKNKIESLLGKTIIFDGDEIRDFFSKIGLKFGYKLSDRDKTVIPKLELLNLILRQNINIIYPTIFLNKLAIKKWTKGIDNLIKIYIKSDIRDIIKFGSKKKIYKNKNVVGLDIKPVYPKKPHIIVENNFKKDTLFLSKEVSKKLNKIFKKK